MLNKSDLKSLQILSWMSEYFEIRTCWPKMNNDKLITPKYWYYILLIATKNCTLKNHKSFGNIVWCYISPNRFYKWLSITMGIINIHDEEKIWIFKKIFTTPHHKIKNTGKKGTKHLAGKNGTRKLKKNININKLYRIEWQKTLNGINWRQNWKHQSLSLWMDEKRTIN